MRPLPLLLALTLLTSTGCLPGGATPPGLSSASSSSKFAAVPSLGDVTNDLPQQDPPDASATPAAPGDGLPGLDSPEAPASSGDRAGHAVVLVHGLAMVGATMMPMQAYLSAQGLPEVHTLDLPGGGGVASTMEECAAAVEALVDQLAARGITKVDLVGHSMGGLVIREYARARRDTSVEIATLITVATPNHGNGTVASLLETIGQKSAVSQMASNSDFIARINASPLPAGTRGYGLRTPNDEVVRPNESCLLPGGRNYSVDVGGLGAHALMGSHPSSLQLVHRLLVGAPPPA